MVVLKFGGTSVGSPESIKQLRGILQAELSKRNKLAVVASAFSGVTNSLESLGEKAASGDQQYIEDFNALREKHIIFCRELGVENIPELDDWLQNLKDALHGVYLVREFSARLRDFVMSFGERFSCRIISAFLQESGLQCRYLDARELIRTDNRFGAARVAFDETKSNISKVLDDLDGIAMITGFIASTEKGETTTLGRGGSDYTAAITGAAVSAGEVQIWTDVDGVMTADPRKVPDAFSLSAITYAEAMELSHFGAKVLYAPTIQPLLEAQIPIRIMNTFRPEFNGTLISGEALQENQPVRGITSVPKVALVLLQGSGMIGVPGTAGRLFSCLARSEINILLISQASSEHSICLAIMPEDVMAAQRAIWQEFQYEIAAGSIDEPSVETDCAIVSVVGDKMRHLPGLSGELFSSLGKEEINVKVIAQGSSERNISIVIAEKDELRALNCIHSRFFQQTDKLNLFLIGTGLIGRELLSQLASDSQNDLTPHIELRGIANSRQMTFGHINLSNWEETLTNSKQDSVLDDFIENMLRLKLPNSIFLDCTGSAIAVPFYESILASGISVVTPNKKACSGSYAVYDALKRVSNNGGCFFYETNVGAGLPVIRTLQELRSTGDAIQ
ncbi:MAG: aspartate kinase, partial [Calditrichota bacterium]